MERFFTRAFTDLTGQERELVGGKGASLAALMRAGFSVPAGFVITAEAFRQALEASELYEEIRTALRTLERGDDSNIESISAYLREQIQALPLLAELEDEIGQAVDLLQASFVAVRSSATVEDGMVAAWAGQLESYLNCSRADLLSHVKACWASLYTSRAITYCLQQEVDICTVAVAVVVQEMVTSEAAGIAFSQHPVTGVNNQLVIEAGYGLGELVVSGQITPDTYLLQKTPLTLQEKHKHRQTKMLVRNDQGQTVEMPLTMEQQEIAVLTDKEILELGALVSRVEETQGFPVDIEWAKVGSRFFVLQARPITTAVQSEAFFLRQKPWCFAVSRPFNWFVESMQVRAMETEIQFEVFGWERAVQNYLILNGDEYYCDQDEARIHEQFLEAFSQDEYFFQRFAEKEEQIIADARTYTMQLRAQDFSVASNQELQHALSKFREAYLQSFLPTWVRPDAFLETQVRAGLTTELSIGVGEVDRIFAQIATPLHPSLAYADEPLALLLIAKQIRDCQADLDSPLVESLLEQHQKQYGWMKGPLAREDLAFSVQEYRERLHHLLPEDVEGLIRRTKQVRDERELSHRAFLERYHPSLRLQALINALRAFIWLRTRTTEVSDYLFFVARTGLLTEVAKRLKLTNAEVVTATPEELIGWLSDRSGEMKLLLEARRQGFAIIRIDGDTRWTVGEEVANWQDQAWQELNSPRQTDNEVLRGVCACPGSVAGIVRIVKTGVDVTALAIGEIMVASMTLPEYTGAMEKAAGFITDEGGITCHAAIIAREMGKPCVIGTQYATRFLKTGDRVELFADRGIIRRVAVKEVS
jgi:phosphohistidine swiveling domain-containing protein